MLGKALLALLIIVTVFVIILGLIQFLWDYITDTMFPGAQEQGLIADEIEMIDALILVGFITLIGIGIGGASRS